MYFVRDIGGHKPFPAIAVKADAWEAFFAISRAIHADKIDAFRASIAPTGDRVGVADLAAATIASLYRAGKLPNSDVEGMLELCAYSLSNHQFRSVSLDEIRGRVFQVQHVITAVLGCQNLQALKQRARAAVALCVDTGKAMRIVPSGLKPPRGMIRTNEEYKTLREYIDGAIRRRKADILHEPTIFPVIDEGESSDTKQNIRNILTKDGIIPSEGTRCLIIVSSTFHLMQIAKIINSHIQNNDFSITKRFEFVALVGAERTEDAADFTPYDWQYVKQLAFQLYLDHLE